MNVVDATRTVLERMPDALFVAALGTVTAALRAVSEDGPHLYMGGAMGSAAAVALGVAEHVAPRRVAALVGDGEMLMSTRTLWTVAGVRPRNLAIIVMADGRYTITGGQRIEAAAAFAGPASALPGLSAARAATSAELVRALDELALPGLIEVAIDTRVTPAASPFVDPHRVRAAFETEVARGRPGAEAAGRPASQRGPSRRRGPTARVG
jgi:thiamine pyrophosphate-dependent acetolactate synthase large subunit-like protein